MLTLHIGMHIAKVTQANTATDTLSKTLQSLRKAVEVFLKNRRTT